MIDRASMYNGNDAETTKVSGQDDKKIEILQDTVVVETKGKKASVVTKEQHDRVVAELAKTQKQLRILTTEVQQMKRVINSLSKSMVEGFRDRFDRY
ncbi:MAG: hypothetical protein M0R77_02355 [Gammaproteobacteria bacterium]|nr:hypothetical protein [Gammaproteobacteria bacterium]